MLCYICGRSDFKSYEHFKMHHKNVHNVHPLGQSERKHKDVIDVPFVALLPDKKREIVTRLETKLREKAWLENKLNPFIGEDKITKEPMWNEQKEVLE